MIRKPRVLCVVIKTKTSLAAFTMTGKCSITSAKQKAIVLLWPGSRELEYLVRRFKNDGVLTITFEDVEFNATASDLPEILTAEKASLQQS